MDLTAQVKEALKTSIAELVETHHSGHLNDNQTIKIDGDKKVFVKMNKKAGSNILFTGEKASLEAIAKTNTIRVPQPIAIITRPKSEGGGSGLIMEHIPMKALDEYQGTLGEQLARMHLHNSQIEDKTDTSSLSGRESEWTKPPKYIGRFGFHCPTFCGFLAQSNHWDKDWVTFYNRRVIQPQIDMLQHKFGEKEAVELWSRIHPKLPYFFRNLTIIPSLLHGALWFGSTAEDEKGPIAYDPASFYGHHEFDLALCKQYGGFNQAFFDNYRRHIPKDKGFDDRIKLYQLSHYVHNWNHYGDASRPTAISTLRDIAKKCDHVELRS